MFERLTHKVFGSEAYIYDDCIHERPFTCENKICYEGKAIDRLAAYEDSGLSPEEVQELAKAKAEGRLVELPCKVGDIVYVVSGCLFYREDAPYTPCEVVVFKKGKRRCIMMHLRPLCEEAAGTRYHRWFPVTSIGKTVFLTREAAEKALESETERGEEG